MKLTLIVKLNPDIKQFNALLETMKTFNKACDFIAEFAFNFKTANKVRLQKTTYKEVRERFKLSAQLTIRAISKVCEAYKRNKKIKPTFKPHSAVVYDQRILSWKGLDKVSILTLSGRLIIPVRIGQYQEARLHRIVRQCDLIFKDKTFYLAVTVDTPEPTPDEPKDFIGIDLGIVNIAADSDGIVYSGNKVNGIRKRYAKIRSKIQSKGTKSAKRLLKKRSKKEKHFATNINHIISKEIVAKAKHTGKGIALEDLKGIRARIRVRKAQQRQQHSWSFYQFRKFIEYKAKLVGVIVKIIDPRNTSRTCPHCGCIDKHNRSSQSVFKCVSCGFAGLADTIAANNIRRAAVNQPNVEAT